MSGLVHRNNALGDLKENGIAPFVQCQIHSAAHNAHVVGRVALPRVNPINARTIRASGNHISVALKAERKAKTGHRASVRLAFQHGYQVLRRERTCHAPAPCALPDASEPMREVARNRFVCRSFRSPCAERSPLHGLNVCDPRVIWFDARSASPCVVIDFAADCHFVDALGQSVFYSHRSNPLKSLIGTYGTFYHIRR